MVKIDRGALRQAGSLDHQDIRAGGGKRRPAPTYFPTDELTQSMKKEHVRSYSRAKADTCKAKIQQKRDTSNRFPSSS